ncbi:his Kinase A domain protein, partial [Vibrio parahaemolyticus V-223/04]
TSKVWRLG